MGSSRRRNSTGSRAHLRRTGHVLRSIDLHAILGHLAEAVSILRVAHRSLEGRELAGTGDESSALRVGLTLLDAVYAELDLAAQQRDRGTA